MKNKKDIDVAVDMLRMRVEHMDGFATIGIDAAGRLVVYTTRPECGVYPRTCGGHRVIVKQTPTTSGATR